MAATLIIIAKTSPTIRPIIRGKDIPLLPVGPLPAFKFGLGG